MGKCGFFQHQLQLYKKKRTCYKAFFCLFPLSTKHQKQSTTEPAFQIQGAWVPSAVDTPRVEQWEPLVTSLGVLKHVVPVA